MFGARRCFWPPEAASLGRYLSAPEPGWALDFVEGRFASGCCRAEEVAGGELVGAHRATWE